MYLQNLLSSSELRIAAIVALFLLFGTAWFLVRVLGRRQRTRLIASTKQLVAQAVTHARSDVENNRSMVPAFVRLIRMRIDRNGFSSTEVGIGPQGLRKLEMMASGAIPRDVEPKRRKPPKVSPAYLLGATRQQPERPARPITPTYELPEVLPSEQFYSTDGKTLAVEANGWFSADAEQPTDQAGPSQETVASLSADGGPDVLVNDDQDPEVTLIEDEPLILDTDERPRVIAIGPTLCSDLADREERPAAGEQPDQTREAIELPPGLPGTEAAVTSPFYRRLLVREWAQVDDDAFGEEVDRLLAGWGDRMEVA